MYREGELILEIQLSLKSGVLDHPPLYRDAVMGPEARLGPQSLDEHLVGPEVTHLLVRSIQTVEVTVALVVPRQARHASVTREAVRTLILLHCTVFVKTLGLVRTVVTVVCAVADLCGVDALA